eukprot:scaffold48501_cov30-Tisochrysis_lutea.AAC.2
MFSASLRSVFLVHVLVEWQAETGRQADNGGEDTAEHARGREERLRMLSGSSAISGDDGGEAHS